MNFSSTAAALSTSHKAVVGLTLVLVAARVAASAMANRIAIKIGPVPSKITSILYKGVELSHNAML